MSVIQREKESVGYSTLLNHCVQLPSVALTCGEKRISIIFFLWFEVTSWKNATGEPERVAQRAQKMRHTCLGTKNYAASGALGVGFLGKNCLPHTHTWERDPRVSLLTLKRAFHHRRDALSHEWYSSRQNATVSKPTWVRDCCVVTMQRNAT